MVPARGALPEGSGYASMPPRGIAPSSGHRRVASWRAPWAATDISPRAPAPAGSLDSVPTSRLSGPHKRGQIPAKCRDFKGRTHDLPYIPANMPENAGIYRPNDGPSSTQPGPGNLVGCSPMEFRTCRLSLKTVLRSGGSIRLPVLPERDPQLLHPIPERVWVHA